MPKNDLQPSDFPEVSWTSGSYTKALTDICNYASEQAQNAIQWYYSSRQARRHFCRICRLGAILLTAFAGMLPLANEIIAARQTAPQSDVAPTAQIKDSTASGERSNTGSTDAIRNPGGEPGRESVSNRHTLHPLWSAIAIAIAGTLILIDRFYGFTTGWIRYLLTAQRLTQILEAFRLDVQRQKINWGNPEPSAQQAAARSEERRVGKECRSRWSPYH